MRYFKILRRDGYEIVESEQHPCEPIPQDPFREHVMGENGHPLIDAEGEPVVKLTPAPDLPAPYDGRREDVIEMEGPGDLGTQIPGDDGKWRPIPGLAEDMRLAAIDAERERTLAHDRKAAEARSAIALGDGLAELSDEDAALCFPWLHQEAALNGVALDAMARIVLTAMADDEADLRARELAAMEAKRAVRGARR